MFLGLLLLFLVFSVLLFAFNFRKNKNIVFLTGFLFLFSLYGLTHYVVSMSQSVFWGAILYVNFTPFYLLCGAFLYFYVRNSLEDSFRFSSKDWLHFLPFVIHLIGLIPYLFKPFSEKTVYIKKLYADPELIVNAQVNLFFNTTENFIIRLFLLLGYSLVNIYLIYRYYQKKSKSLLPEKEQNLTLKWLLSLNIYVILIVLFYGLFIIKLHNYSGNIFSLFNDALLYASAGSMALIVGSLLIFPHILYGLPARVKALKNIHTDISTNHIRKEKNTSEIARDDDYFLQLKNEIEHYFECKKPYLSNDFKMADIILNINAPQHHISYCLSFYFKKSLPELKTHYRVSWAKNALIDNKYKYKNIEAIGQKAGYSSKSAFFKAFKDYTGITPQEYQKLSYTSSKL